MTCWDSSPSQGLHVTLFYLEARGDKRILIRANTIHLMPGHKLPLTEETTLKSSSADIITISRVRTSTDIELLESSLKKLIRDLREVRPSPYFGKQVGFRLL
ncbi:hypothetical protein T310_10057 [Rasamsonia emersonii CBS 393.64]|uniref:Uncharacterized protein n=1 Tax=Rasamsonia emersonii (strain ATCC 16479 / CBS 393.64 / IMI 116815) TaxID=1408163 RepID=A0A0F4YEL4_RASE3|nr:hypothetical protein T310_10057 [Rasamsonia emersonii CBS 393.64]KKA16361.1 hypothetical protein T310_10057 [Rasamsonia emersonii CBS 393.64]